MPMGIDKARHERPSPQINNLRVISGRGQYGLRASYRLYHAVAHTHGLSDGVIGIHGQDRAIDIDLVVRRRNGTRDDRE